MSKITEFFRTEYHRMVRFVRRLIDDSAERDAEDIVQDVMLSIFDHADVLAPIENISAYVYMSLRNKVIDLLRRRKKVETLTDAFFDVRSDTLLKVEKEEILDYVFQAMDCLDEESRAVVVATEFEGYAFQELSKKWNVPLGTLLAKKSRAIKKIRKKLTGLV